VVRPPAPPNSATLSMSCTSAADQVRASKSPCGRRACATAARAPAHAPVTADYEQLAAAAGTRPRPPIVAACGPGWEPASLPDGILLLTGLQQALDAVTQLL
jgi:hypothetical protein